ncbi:MAG: Uma2 family endonuclease [Armatimonadetes bacterium]|nr:Uma2 family endonuclease [Armatimonadota bacterium]
MSAQKVPLPLSLFTVDDFFRLVRGDHKADLIDGVIYMASPDTPRNDRIAYLVRFLIQGYARVKGLGQTTGPRVAYVLSDRRALEPDVAFVARDRRHILQESHGVGAPDIAVEIVSADSVAGDYMEKKHLYEEAGVREYWLIDPLQNRAEFHRLLDRHYVLVPLEHNRLFRSEVLPGFWLDVQWLLADPLPDEFDCLQQILAGNPA